MIGAAQPFEDDHLGGDDLGPVALHAADRGLLRLPHPRADRVLHHDHAPAMLQQAEHGLADADMRLAAADDQLAIPRERLEEGRLGANRSSSWR